MKRLGLLVLAACVMAAGCDDDATAPSNLPLVLSANMRATNETTPVTGGEALATGAANITLKVTRDSANNVTGGTADMYFQVANMPRSSSIILAHIHVGPSGVAGPVVVNTGLTPTTAIPISGNGSAELNVTSISVPADLLNSIIANPANYYFNVHSVLFPGGVVRGQLSRVQ